MIGRLFIQEGAERRLERTTMENLYYVAIYDILRNTHPCETTATSSSNSKPKYYPTQHGTATLIPGR